MKEQEFKTGLKELDMSVKVVGGKYYFGDTVEYNLKVFLLKHNLSMSKYARKLGISPSYLCKIIKNKRPLTKELLFNIYDTYDELEKGEK